MSELNYFYFRGLIIRLFEGKNILLFPLIHKINENVFQLRSLDAVEMLHNCA